MYERYKKVKFQDNSIEAEASEIDDKTWKEMEDDKIRQMLDLLVKHVQTLEDRVSELDELEKKVAALESAGGSCGCGCCDG